MSITAFIVAGLLTSPLPVPVAGLLGAPATSDSEQAPESDYSSTVAQVASLDERMNFGEPVNGDLMDALASLPRYAPQLAADPATQQLRTRAQLQLARSALSEGDRDAAIWIVDEAIRSVLGAEIQIAEFGPSLARLYEERRVTLAESGQGGVEIQCAEPCRIFLNEHEIGASIAGLPLGVYRLWVEPVDAAGSGTALTEVLLLQNDGEVVTRIFDPNPPPVVEDLPEPPVEPIRRIMPRGAESFLVAAGVGMAVAGALLMAIQPTKGDLVAGGTLFGCGGAALLAGGVTLGFDEVRVGNQRGRQAMVAWTLRF